MIIDIKEFQEVCKTVLAATDTSELSTLNETLELETEGDALYLSTTNGEYYARVRFPIPGVEAFHASVNANLFLKLIAAVTTETVEIVLHDTYLNVKANGNYKIPLIFENDHMLSIPPITIQNPTVDMNISGAVLDSIVNFNSKQLTMGNAVQPVQKLFYLDNEGCITFTSGACVNNFQLPQPVRVLLNARLVNLFKLFKGDMVHFTLGYDALSEKIIQTKVSFATGNITLTAVTGCDDSLLSQVPVGPIRNRANKDYEYKVVFNVKELSAALNRLLLFNTDKNNTRPYSVFKFSSEGVTIYDTREENTEVVRYQNSVTFPEEYTMKVDLTHFKKVIDNCTEAYATLNFGSDHACCVVVRGSIKNVIPQVVVRNA